MYTERERRTENMYKKKEYKHGRSGLKGSVENMFNEIHLKRLAVHAQILLDSLDVHEEIVLDETQEASFHDIDVLGRINAICHFRHI